MFPNEKEITTKLFVVGLLDITCLDSWEQKQGTYG